MFSLSYPPPPFIFLFPPSLSLLFVRSLDSFSGEIPVEGIDVGDHVGVGLCHGIE